MADRIRVFNNEPADDSTEVGLNDVFVADGGDTYTLANKTNLLMGASVQAEAVLYYFYNNGYVKDDVYDFILSSSPPVSAVIVAPHVSTLSFAAYDTDDVTGVDDPRISERAFYIGDPYDIYQKKYLSAPGEDGIQLEFIDHIDGLAINSTMMSLACATADLDGTAMTYVTGILETAEFKAFSTLAVSAESSDTEIQMSQVSAAEEFPLGDYLVINRGGINEEIRKFTGRVDDILTIAPLNYDHDAGETVYNCLRKIWGKLLVTEDATGNQAASFYSTGLRASGTVESRL